MRPVAVAALATLCLSILFVTPSSAQTPQPPAQGSSQAAPPQPQPQSSSMPTPHDGRAFGQHVSGMAPEHPRDHGGAMFGECVSALATTGDCPHQHDHEEDDD